jgi:hypothetical protein
MLLPAASGCAGIAGAAQPREMPALAGSDGQIGRAVQRFGLIASAHWMTGHGALRQNPQGSEKNATPARPLSANGHAAEAAFDKGRNRIPDSLAKLEAI